MIDLEMLCIITDRNNSESYVNLIESYRLPLTLTAFGKGTATIEILDAFCLAAEKTVLFSVSKTDKVRRAIRGINKRHGIKNPGTSIVFTIALSSIGGEITAHYLSDDQVIERREYPMQKDDDFELVIAITNEGYSSAVMDAAKGKGGANGGTVLHARGISNQKAKKFFGIFLSDEREIVFIVCRKKLRNPIMQAIIEDIGFSTKARTMVFSVPVSSVSGLLDDQEDEDEE